MRFRKPTKWSLAALAGTAAVATVWFVMRLSVDTATSYPPPARPESAYRNTDLDTAFVGAAACAECHPDEHRTWQHTAHSLALDDVELETEPPAGAFRDATSGRRYEISRRGGRLWHAEFLDSASDPVLLSEHVMQYVMGSGRFSRTYLFEDDGFLMESPCTWYTARPGWGLSPGYDRFNMGFERPTELRCVQCHVGRVEPLDNSPHRLAIHVQSIDCERCHGPGAIHVADHGAGDPSTAGNATIVNPGKLGRSLSEDVCAQCHFHGEATVMVRGRNWGDFRPGLPLRQFQVHYGFDDPNSEMTVVGHFEQMRLSECYQQSETLTCTTCHDPHAHSESRPPITDFDRHCAECHRPDHCGLTAVERTRTDPEGSCVRCHMPQVPTEIPHFAFTHHRIANHDDPEPDAPAVPRIRWLVPLDDVAWMSEVDQDRCLGLAYVELLASSAAPEIAEAYQKQALELLESVAARGLVDAEVDAALARLYFGRNWARTLKHAELALQSGALSPDAESTALFALASALSELGRPDKAVPHLERLVRIRRHAGAWGLLSAAYEAQGDLPSALSAAQRAVDISPASDSGVRRVEMLARRLGDEDLANSSARRAELLQRASQGEP